MRRSYNRKTNILQGLSVLIYAAGHNKGKIIARNRTMHDQFLSLASLLYFCSNAERLSISNIS